ncbi:MAG: hypothetical protein A2277_00475 [Desulfobacterales bacterium RIFOXYA12_FULL_46_15]|nr:MAG: hypothetical protein A2277_00475 [Desulfobacterales bacterium RIFOXYA12_FULL_46_15]
MYRTIDNPHRPKPLYSVDPSYEGDTLCCVPSSPEEMRAAMASLLTIIIMIKVQILLHHR